MYLNKLIVLLLALTSHFAFSSPKNLSEDWTQTFKIQDDILNEQSAYQKITIFKNRSLGKILMIDNIVQYSEKDEFIYHEMISHVPLMIHPNPKRILIIGGGDGPCIREAIKHPSIEEVIVIELDGRVVDLCKQNFSNLANGAFEDRRVHLLIDDGYNYLKKTNYTFDVIIVNSTDPLGPARSLFHKHFFSLCKNALTSEGILVCQAGSPITQLAVLKNSLKLKKELFDSSFCYFAPAPSQLGGIKAFTISFKSETKNFLDHKRIQKRYKDIEGQLKYYNPKIHKNSFETPKYLEQELQAISD
ncbi:MAG: Polyamine aminopropyltransferase [Chlamydiae bacterium]|nr:Polyamine aminopropyltransferase [Chlamydiota bacterium]